MATPDPNVPPPPRFGVPHSPAYRLTYALVYRAPPVAFARAIQHAGDATGSYIPAYVLRYPEVSRIEGVFWHPQLATNRSLAVPPWDYSPYTGGGRGGGLLDHWLIDAAVPEGTPLAQLPGVALVATWVQGVKK